MDETTNSAGAPIGRKLTLPAGRINFIAWVIAFRVTLDTSYLFIVSPIYSYYGLTLVTDLSKIVESYILMFGLLFLVPSQVKKPSDVFATLFFIAPLLPTLSYYGLNNQSREFLFMLVASYVVFLFARRIPMVNTTRLIGGKIVFLAMAAVLLAAVIIWLILNGGIDQFTLSLTQEIYELRRESGSAFWAGPFGYLNDWVVSVSNMALLAWAISRRKLTFAMLIIAAQLLIFGILHHKIVLFFPVLSLGIYYCLRFRNPFQIIFLGLITIIGISAMIGMVFDAKLLVSIFIVRVFYLPALLHFAYFDFFSQNGFVYMSSSIFSFLFDYPFAYSPAHLIGNDFFGAPETNANTGYLATAYMHFGYVGMIVFAAITGVLVRIVDILTIGRMSTSLAVAITIGPFWNLFLNADLGTAILTHGILFSFLVLWLFSANDMPLKKIMLPSSKGHH